MDVVIQTLGVGLGDLFRPVHLFSDATRVLIAAMRTEGVKRPICVTGFGAGDSLASIRSRRRNPRGTLAALELGYRVFLPVRPFISRVIGQVLKLQSAFEGAKPR